MLFECAGDSAICKKEFAYFPFFHLTCQDGQTALYVASKKGYSKIVEALLNREADVNHQTKVMFLMPLVFCTSSIVSGVVNQYIMACSIK